MRQDDGPVERDEELGALLEQWDSPAVPEGLDERMLTLYRRAYVPLWRRWSVVPVRIALPVAVSLLLVTAAALLTHRAGPAPSPTAVSASEPPATAVVRAEPETPRSSLAGFQPMDEVTATVVTENP